MKKGFTLIEVIIYIALFTILMVGGFVTAYQLIAGNATLNTKDSIEEEGNFVSRKIDWALTGISTSTSDIISPPAVATSSTLSIKKIIAGVKTSVVIQFNIASSSIEMKEASGSFSPITTANVKVTGLSFKYVAPNGNAPAGIIATSTINGVDFVVTKYIRK